MIRYNVDHFKDINGVYGHSVGDKLLRDMAECMRAIDSEDAISAHLNADHFVRFCASDVLTAQESYDNFSRVLDNYNLSIPITLHAGVYDLCEYGEDPYTMSYKALLAMQSIKGDMEKKIAYYEKGMLRQEQERLELLNDVEKGIAENQFEVWFQPQVDYAEKRLSARKHWLGGTMPQGECCLPERLFLCWNGAISSQKWIDLCSTPPAGICKNGFPPCRIRTYKFP